MLDNAYRQDIVTRTPITPVELITISTVTIRSIWHNSAADFLRFWKFLPQICESCGVTYRRNYKAFSALLSASGPLTNSEKNVEIDAYFGVAILPQTGTKLPKKRGSKFGAVVAPSDATEKNRNVGAQQQSILYTTAQKRFGKIYFLYEFWCAQTCSFRAVFGLPIRTLTLAVSAR